MKTIKLKHLALTLCTVLIAGIMQMNAQVILDSQNRIDIPLESGDVVTLYGKAKTRDQSFSNEYYYLPVNLRMSMKADGKTPEFLFAKYTTEERADNGGVQGAILHSLMMWGLTPKQEEEVTQKLRGKLKALKVSNPLYSNISPDKATVNGAATLKTGNSKFRVISATLSGGQKEERNIITSSAPVIPGAKVAIAAKMDKNDAQLLASTFEKGRAISDLSVTIDYQYDVLFPAVDGEIVFHWDRINSIWDSDNIRHDVVMQKYKHGWFGWKTSHRTERVSHSEAEYFFQQMIDEKVVEINIDKNIDDEVANQISTQFLQLFMQSIADASTNEDFNSGKNSELEGNIPDTEGDDDENSPENDYSYGNSSWTFNSTKYENKYAKKTERYNLRYRTPITMEGNITANLASFYDQAKHNKACVYSVNLNDPFFQHRDIVMVLDLDAEEIFKDEVNYVTVNVRKRRDSGYDFEDQVTIDQKHIAEKGIRAALTYARGEDANPENYEYKTQWSLRGGNIYPRNPRWNRGDWEGISLDVPIRPRTIDFEANLEDLKEQDITRATLQVRYEKFGQEYQKNLHASVVGGKALVEETIYTDKDQPGYAYRIIFNHENLGKMVTEWEVKSINDDYVFATIPEELRKGDPTFIEDLLRRGREMENDTESNGAVKKGKNILGKLVDRWLDRLEKRRGTR